MQPRRINCGAPTSVEPAGVVQFLYQPENIMPYNQLSVRPFSYLFNIGMPFVCLVLLLIFPPHGLDLQVSQLFWLNGEWVGQGHPVLEFFGHELIKAFPAVIAFFYLFLVFRAVRAGNSLEVHRSAFVITGLLVTLFAVWWLKRTTGVFCPWSTTPFGGEQPILDPVLHFTRVRGNCWPAGHAGTGFGLFVLYFAWRDVSRQKALFWLGTALLIGIFCSILRVSQGAHFLSHTIASFLIDWTLAALLYALWLRPKEIRTRAAGRL